MAIIQRRVFYGKVGAADQLVAHLQEGDKALRQHGVDFKSRLLTDYMSGRSDRVAAEWEVNGLADIDAGLGRVMADPQMQPFFDTWLKKLNELIYYSEAENWTIR